MKNQIVTIAFLLTLCSAVNLCAQNTTKPRQKPQVNVTQDVIPPADIFVPNAFTPNDDGKNDVFNVYGTGLSDMDVSIFDIRGKLVYQWRGLNGFWDGTSGGQAVVQGIYVYIIN